MSQRLPSLNVSNRTFATMWLFVEIVRLAIPDEMRVVDGSPRKNAICAATPMRNPAEGFDPITGAMIVIFCPGWVAGRGGLCRHARMMSGRSVSCSGGTGGVFCFAAKAGSTSRRAMQRTRTRAIASSPTHGDWIGNCKEVRVCRGKKEGKENLKSDDSGDLKSRNPES